MGMAGVALRNQPCQRNDLMFGPLNLRIGGQPSGSGNSLACFQLAPIFSTGQAQKGVIRRSFDTITQLGSE